MSEAVVDDIVAVLPPLLQSLEALAFIARHLNPPDFAAVMEARRHARTRRCRPSVYGWPIGRGQFADVKTSLELRAMRRLRHFLDCARSSTATVT